VNSATKRVSTVNSMALHWAGSLEGSKAELEQFTAVPKASIIPAQESPREEVASQMDRQGRLKGLAMSLVEGW
jgi:hypothetical protein